MDKITGIISNTHIADTQKKTAGSSDQFKKTLDSAVSKDTPETAPIQKAGSLGEISPVMFSHVETPTQNIINQTSNLLNLLDNYAKDIDNPEKSLKEIEPLIDEINNNALELNLAAGDNLENDNRLKDIATRAAMTASVEYMKFKRGDYV